MSTLTIHHSHGRQPRVAKWLRLQLGTDALALAPASPMQLAGTDPGSRAVESGAEKCFIVRASGDLTDPTRLTEFFRAVESRLASGPDRLVLDLTAVEAADTKLVACLVQVHHLARRASAGVELWPSERVRNWITLCHLWST